MPLLPLPVTKEETANGVGREFEGPCNISEGTKIAAPNIIYQTSGLTIDRIVCASDTSIATIDMENVETQRWM